MSCFELAVSTRLARKTFARSTPLSLDQALLIAVDQSPQIAAQRYGVDAAEKAITPPINFDRPADSYASLLLLEGRPYGKGLHS